MRALTLLAGRFVAGDTAEDAIAAVRRLNQGGLKATLDFLGEECRSGDQAEASAAEILRLLDKLAASGVDSNVSLKLTQLGFNLDEGTARKHLARILDAAAERGNFVRIDMEGSAYTQRTLDCFHGLFKTHENVGVVIQACLKRSAQDVEKLVAAGARVRLCKGAYREPASLAFTRKEDVNRNYDALARALITKGRHPAIATHDDERIRVAMEAASAAGIAKDRFEFQMLYGVRRKRWRELARQGCVVRVYVPYGTHWFPYYYRRIRERKENLLFALRSVWGNE